MTPHDFPVDSQDSKERNEGSFNHQRWLATLSLLNVRLLDASLEGLEHASKNPDELDDLRALCEELKAFGLAMMRAASAYMEFDGDGGNHRGR